MGAELSHEHTPLRRPELSRRETDVLELLAGGLTNPQIALRLEVTVHAVKFHLGAIYQKLGVRNRTEAAVAYLADRADLTDRPDSLG